MRHHRNAYFYTVEISFLSALCLVLSMGMEWRTTNVARHRRRTDGGETIAEKDDDNGDGAHFFQHWTCATLLPVTTRAVAGLLTALVHRHLGSVIKGFALVLGLVLSALLQFALEGVDLTAGQLAGSWLHFSNPVRNH